MNLNHLIDTTLLLQTIGNTHLLQSTVAHICYSTKNITPNSVFFALKGKSVDGASFMQEAYNKGVRLFVSESLQPLPNDALIIQVSDARKALSFASSVFFNHPSQKLTVVGITGTKGKTTTSTLLYRLMNNLNVKAGVIGTNGIFYDNVALPSQNTTPESYEIHRIMNDMVNAGVTVCFMEVSSQGLMMSRVEHVAFNYGVFTNMAYDHIGDLEHPTFDDYLYWKTHLFRLVDVALINADDNYAQKFIATAKHKVMTYSIHQPSDYQATNITPYFDGQQASVSFTYNNQRIQLAMPGIFNVYNGLVVYILGTLLQLNPLDIIKQLQNITVDGRMEFIPNNKGVLAILDFAHNGFAFENILKTVKTYEHNRLIVVFGSVGDRSQTRRKELGDVAAKYADIAILTSDNPGLENPQTIIDDIAQSFVNVPKIVFSIPDRTDAIHAAVKMAQKGDIIVFAGKGHENYQLIGTEKVPFNERVIIQQAFLN